MGLSKSEVQCNAHDMAYQAVEVIKEHFKDYPATKPDMDALYEALTSRWIRESLIAACAREVKEWSSLITMHAHMLCLDHPKILALYKAFDESTANLHVDKEELQKELKVNTPLLHRDWATHEMEAWYLRSLAKRYRTPDFRKMMAKPPKVNVDMYEQSTCLDPALSDEDGNDDADDESSSSSEEEEEEEEEGEEETSEEEDSSEEEEEDDDDDDDDESVANDPSPKRARRESSGDDSDA